MLRVLPVAVVLTVTAACPLPSGTDGSSTTVGSDDDNDGNDDNGGNDDNDDNGGPPAPAPFVYEAVAGSVCGNGTPAGLGLAPLDGDSDTLVLIFNGGGACWDNVSCFGLNAAAHIQTTYSANVLASDVATLQATGLTDRNDVDNPLRDAHFAFVPYCTGDLGAGEAVRQYQADLLGLDIRSVHHMGRANARAFLAVLAARFTTVDTVFVLGASAGGYAAILNDDLVVAAFPAADVHVLADGAPFVQPQNGLAGTWQSQWALPAPECPDCVTSFAKRFEARRLTNLQRRFALITTTNDEVIRTYFGFGVNDMTGAVTALVDAQHDTDNSHALVVTGIQHVLIGGYATPDSAVRRFVVDWAENDPAWATVRP